LLIEQLRRVSQTEQAVALDVLSLGEPGIGHATTSKIAYFCELSWRGQKALIYDRNVIDAVKEHADIFAETVGQVGSGKSHLKCALGYSPLQPTGNGNQNLYLTELNAELATTLLALCGSAAQDIANGAEDGSDADIKSDSAEAELNSRTDIGVTQKLQLVMARRGQGVFRANLRLIETRCRVTGLTIVDHLRASHIKPWRVSTDTEKLDGNNGLLLSPHIDHLFDAGYISFTDDGQLICSARLSANVLDKWRIDLSTTEGSFNAKQREYVRYHRQNVLKLR
jgi:hypothetical protein